MDRSVRPCAILTSDLHLRTTTPRSRAEPDWYVVQGRCLREIRRIKALYNVPLIVAGDLFDDGWRDGKCPPVVVNFAIRNLPKPCYAVPGQHDLPNHRLDLIKDSAYWTLVECKTIVHLDRTSPQRALGGLVTFHGFGWGEKPEKPLHCGKSLKVAVIHAHCYTSATKHPGASKRDHVSELRRRFHWYDVLVVGDSHRPFLDKTDWPIVYNPGGPLNRNSDEKGTERHVGLLYSNGDVELVPLELDEKWKEAEDVVPEQTTYVDAEELIKELNAAGSESYDFAKSVTKYLKAKKVNNRVKDLIISVLANVKKGKS